MTSSLKNQMVIHALDAQTKHEIAQTLVLENRTKTDLVQDVWHELVRRGVVHEPSSELSCREVRWGVIAHFQRLYHRLHYYGLPDDERDFARDQLLQLSPYLRPTDQILNASPESIEYKFSDGTDGFIAGQKLQRFEGHDLWELFPEAAA